MSRERLRTRRLCPAEIKFTQDSVGMCFQNEIELNTTCEQIAKRELEASSLRTIRVREINGIYNSLDNRRLYVFRVLNILGILDKIKVVMWEDPDIPEREITNGCHVALRNRRDNNGRWIFARTYRHCNCSQGSDRSLPEWWNTDLLRRHRNMIARQNVHSYGYSPNTGNVQLESRPAVRYDDYSGFDRPSTSTETTSGATPAFQQQRPAANQSNLKSLLMFLIVLFTLFMFWLRDSR